MCSEVCPCAVCSTAALVRRQRARGTCGEVQEAQVRIHDGLVAQHQQRHLRRGRLAGGGLHLPDRQQHLRRAAQALGKGKRLPWRSRSSCTSYATAGLGV